VTVACVRLTIMFDEAGTDGLHLHEPRFLYGGRPFASDTGPNIYSNRLRVGGVAQPTGAWTNGFAYDEANG